MVALRMQCATISTTEPGDYPRRNAHSNLPGRAMDRETRRQWIQEELVVAGSRHIQVGRPALSPSLKPLERIVDLPSKHESLGRNGFVFGEKIYQAVDRQSPLAPVLGTKSASRRAGLNERGSGESPA